MKILYFPWDPFEYLSNFEPFSLYSKTGTGAGIRAEGIADPAGTAANMAGLAGIPAVVTGSAKLVDC